MVVVATTVIVVVIEEETHGPDRAAVGVEAEVDHVAGVVQEAGTDHGTSPVHCQLFLIIILIHNKSKLFSRDRNKSSRYDRHHRHGES